MKSNVLGLALAIIELATAVSEPSARVRPVLYDTLWQSEASLTTPLQPILVSGESEQVNGIEKQTAYALFMQTVSVGQPAHIWVKTNFVTIEEIRKGEPPSFDAAVQPSAAADNMGNLVVVAKTAAGTLVLDAKDPNAWRARLTLANDCASPATAFMRDPYYGAHRFYVICRTSTGSLKQFMYDPATHAVEGPFNLTSPETPTFGPPTVATGQVGLGTVAVAAVGSDGNAYVTTNWGGGGVGLPPLRRAPISTTGTGAKVAIVLHHRRLHLAIRRSVTPFRVMYIQSNDDPYTTFPTDPASIWLGRSWAAIAPTSLAKTKDVSMAAFRHVLLIATTYIDDTMSAHYRDPNNAAASPPWKGGWTIGTSAYAPSMGSSERTHFQGSPFAATSYNHQELYATTRGLDGRPMYVNLFRAVALALARDCGGCGRVGIQFSNELARQPGNTTQACIDCEVKTCAPGGIVKNCVPGQIPCGPGYSCFGAGFGASYYCRKNPLPNNQPCTLDAHCGTGETCVHPNDGTHCVNPTAPEQESPILVDAGLGLMVLPSGLITQLKQQQIAPIALFTDCSRTGNAGVVIGQPSGADAVAYGPDIMPTAGVHELTHLIVNRAIAGLTPWTASSGGVETFDMTGGDNAFCSPLCTTPACTGCAAPYICTGSVALRCGPESCVTSNDCLLPNGWQDQCELNESTNACNAGRAYGFVNAYASNGNCDFQGQGCHAFVEGLVTYRFGGDRFRVVAQGDIARWAPFNTKKTCDQYLYVRNSVYAGTSFSGFGADRPYAVYQSGASGNRVG